MTAEAHSVVRLRRVRPDVRRNRPTRTKMVYILVSALACMSIVRAWAQEPLTEREAVRIAVSRPDLAAVLDARRQNAEAALLEAKVYPNPSLEYSRERLGLPAGNSTEDRIALSQPVDISGRRGLRRQAAEHRVEAARMSVEEQRLAVALEVRRVFSDLLFRMRAAEALRGLQQRLVEAEALVERLRRAGEVSGYDRRRLARERVAVEAQVATFEAARIRAWEQLLGLLGAPDEVARFSGAAGELLPDEAPALELLETQLTQRPDLVGLTAQAQAFERDRQAAARGWIPDLTIGVGQKRLKEPGVSDTGVILSFSLPLPIFDRSQGAQRRADAQLRQLRGEHALASARALGELRGAWRQAAHLRSAAVRYRSEAVNSSRELTRIAEAAYKGGERGILELLDAQRLLADSQTTALELELRAREARLELDRIVGETPHD